MCNEQNRTGNCCSSYFKFNVLDNCFIFIRYGHILKYMEIDHMTEHDVDELIVLIVISLVIFVVLFSLLIGGGS